MAMRSSVIHSESGQTEPDTTAMNNDEPEVLCHWSARKMQPIVLLYVAAVFVAFMVLSYFVFHSMTAVKALAMTAVGSVVALVPGVTSQVEYRLTDLELERRPLNKKDPKEFESVFQMDQLSHVVPMRHGFKFYLPLSESSPVRRFWKAHVSDAYSGEVHVETSDREKVLDLLAQHGIPCRRSHLFEKIDPAS